MTFCYIYFIKVLVFILYICIIYHIKIGYMITLCIYLSWNCKKGLLVFYVLAVYVFHACVHNFFYFFLIGNVYIFFYVFHNMWKKEINDTQCVEIGKWYRIWFKDGQPCQMHICFAQLHTVGITLTSPTWLSCKQLRKLNYT